MYKVLTHPLSLRLSDPCSSLPKLKLFYTHRFKIPAAISTASTARDSKMDVELAERVPLLEAP